MEAKYNGFLSGVDPDKIFSPAMQTEKEFIESKGFPNWEIKNSTRGRSLCKSLFSENEDFK